ncbi:hypothetical protein FRC03_003730, partial [Tulasnella sp. 419]
MRFTHFAALLASLPLAVYAQDPVIAALQQNGLTQLASVVQSVSNTTEGRSFIGQISGGPRTLFAPNDAAFSAANLDTSNSTAVVSLLSYHLVSGYFPNPYYFTVAPQHTVLRTFLTDPAYVRLEDTFPQVLVTESGDGTNVHILRQQQNVTVQSTVIVSQNLVVHVINGVLLAPTNDAISQQPRLSALVQNFGQTQAYQNLASARGFTLFAPENAAISRLVTSGAATNLSSDQINTIIGNHVINGATVYSPQLPYENRISASGQRFSFSSNATGTYVTSGSSTALVLLADIILPNGVIHLIDNVLVNTNNDPNAANSAYSVATSYAASNPTNTGAVGGGTVRSGAPTSTTVTTT